MDIKNDAFALIIGLFISQPLICQPYPSENRQQTNTAAWKKLGPGGGGSTFIPTFSYHTPERFLVRCDMTGSYLTTDGGKAYAQVNFANGAGAYAYDPHSPGTIYVGSADLNRSTDGGKTWTRIFPGDDEIQSTTFSGDHANYSIKTVPGTLYDGGTVNHIRVDPVSPQSIYFSMKNQFFYSDDHGKTWQKEVFHQPVDFIYSNTLDCKNEVYIFTPDTIHIFQKSSRDFKHKAIPGHMSPAYSFTGGRSTGDGKTIFYALHYTDSESIVDEFGHSEVWKSEDRGATWQKVEHVLINNKQSGINPSYSMIRCAEFDASQAYLVCNRYEQKTGSNSTQFWYGALKTSDGGKQWNWAWKGGGGSGQYGVKDGRGVANLKDAWVEKAFGGEYIRLIDVGVYPDDGKVAIVTDWYRTMKTMDGGKTWNEIYSKEQTDGTFTSRGMDVTTNYGVHFDPFDSNHIAVSYTDIGYHHSFNRGESWSRSVAGVPAGWVNTCYWMAFDPGVKNKVWSAWSGMHDFPRGKMTRNPKWKENAKGGICVSEDGGRTWKPTIAGMGTDAPATCIVLDPVSPPGNRTLYATVYNKGVFKSTDDGKTWSVKNKGIEDNTCTFEITLTKSGVLFLTVVPTPMHQNGQKGRGFYSGAVYRSTDGAENWTKLQVTDGALFPNGIEDDPQNPNRIYLACWAAISLGDLVGGDVARSTGGDEVIPMQGGIFLSEDAGNTWTSIFDTSQYVYDVTVDPYHPGRLYCNTFNKAAYRSDDYGKSWKKIKGYDFHWGHRIIVDPVDTEKIYITTYGSSVWHGVPEIE